MYRYSTLSQHTTWHADTSLRQSLISSAIKPYLVDQGSLTATLMQLSDGDFKVNVKRQDIALPYWHEQKKLNRPIHKVALVREVELIIHSEPVVYARSIIPLSLVHKSSSGLASLGAKPLGHVLFKNGRIRVSKRDFAEIIDNQQVISARRTPYDFQSKRILVSEFFLPAFEKYI